VQTSQQHAGCAPALHRIALSRADPGTATPRRRHAQTRVAP
jgi:hypothetical protein